MARKKKASPRDKVRTAVKNVKKAATKAAVGAVKTEKWITKTIQDDYEKAREFKPVRAAESASSGFGQWVSDNKLFAGVAVAVAAAVALAPAVASAVTVPAQPTPAQIAQAEADARRATDNANAMKLAAGAFALVTAATITYAVVSEDEPKRAPTFRPMSLYPNRY